MSDTTTTPASTAPPTSTTVKDEITRLKGVLRDSMERVAKSEKEAVKPKGIERFIFKVRSR